MSGSDVHARMWLWRGLALFSVAFLVSAAAKNFAVRRTTAAKTPQPQVVNVSGRQLVLVYIGQSTCGWCNDPELPALLRVIHDSARSVASARERIVIMQGVSVDRRALVGIEHLNKIASFDEIYSGGWWTNELAFRYVWGRPGGSASTPTIVVLERDITGLDDTTSVVPLFAVSNERVLSEKSGVHAIRRWVRDGVPIPRLVEANSVGSDTIQN